MDGGTSPAAAGQLQELLHAISEARNGQRATETNLVRYRLGRKLVAPPLAAALPSSGTAPAAAPVHEAANVPLAQAGPREARLHGALQAARAESLAFDEQLRRLLI